MAMSFANSGLPSMPRFAGSPGFTESLGQMADINRSAASLALGMIGDKERNKTAAMYGRLAAKSRAPATPARDWTGAALGIGKALTGVLGGLGGGAGNIGNDLKIGFESTPLQNWLP